MVVNKSLPLVRPLFFFGGGVALGVGPLRFPWRCEAIGYVTAIEALRGLASVEISMSDDGKHNKEVILDGYSGIFQFSGICRFLFFLGFQFGKLLYVIWSKSPVWGTAISLLMSIRQQKRQHESRYLQTQQFTGCKICCIFFASFLCCPRNRMHNVDDALYFFDNWGPFSSDFNETIQGFFRP